MERLCGELPASLACHYRSLTRCFSLDEVVQLIFYELIDPGPLTLVSKRFYRFSQSAYVRAHYFLARHGPVEAMFHALGRPQVVDERVLDVRKLATQTKTACLHLWPIHQILLTSGAHLSRYLIQVSMHHYFHTQSHFIKTTWVRNLHFRVFAYFLRLAEDKYGDIPRGKVSFLLHRCHHHSLSSLAQTEDDGYVFSTFLKESRLPMHSKTVGWETIRELLETYNVNPIHS